MPRFTVKDLLRGITLAAVGLTMLTLASSEMLQSPPGKLSPPDKLIMLLRHFLIASGGAFIGYGLAAPCKNPSVHYAIAMVAMFVAMWTMRWVG